MPAGTDKPGAPLNPSPIRSDPVERVKALLDRWMARTAEHLVIAMIKAGEPGVVVMAADEYEGYMHTVEMMGDETAAAALREGEQDVREGLVRPYEPARRLA